MDQWMDHATMWYQLRAMNTTFKDLLIDAPDSEHAKCYNCTLEMGPQAYRRLQGTAGPAALWRCAPCNSKWMVDKLKYFRLLPPKRTLIYWVQTSLLCTHPQPTIQSYQTHQKRLKLRGTFTLSEFEQQKYDAPAYIVECTIFCEDQFERQENEIAYACNKALVIDTHALDSPYVLEKEIYHWTNC